MKNMTKTIAGALLAMTAAQASAANFWGDQIKAGWRLPTPVQHFPINLSPSSILTVGHGVEGYAEVHIINFEIDFGADSLTLFFPEVEAFAHYAFNGLSFEELTDDVFGTIDTVTGIDPGRVKSEGKILTINFSGLQVPAGHSVVVQFVPDVPEPASWAMMIAGLGTVGAAMRRRPHRRVAFS